MRFSAAIACVAMAIVAASIFLLAYIFDERNSEKFSDLYEKVRPLNGSRVADYALLEQSVQAGDVKYKYNLDWDVVFGEFCRNVDLGFDLCSPSIESLEEFFLYPGSVSAPSFLGTFSSDYKDDVLALIKFSELCPIRVGQARRNPPEEEIG